MSSSPIAPGTALNEVIAAVCASADRFTSRLPPVTPMATPTDSANTIVIVLFIALLPSPALAGPVVLFRWPRTLLLSLLEVAQIRRLLAFLDRHQVAVGGHEIALLADIDVLVVLRAIVEIPDQIGTGLAHVSLGHRPGPRQRIVGGGDLVDQHILVGLVDIDALLDDGLAVVMQADAARLIGARTLEPAGLDLERGKAAARIRIDPLADRETIEGRFHLLGPVPTVSKDSPRHGVVGQDVGGLRHDDDFHRIDDRHDPRHAVWNALTGRIVALSACGLVGDAGLVASLVFWRQRRLLPGAERLGLIPLDTDSIGPLPLAG